MYINREIEDEIEPFLKRKEAIAILGPRQAGKTTLLKFLEKKLAEGGKKVKFITFEKRDDLDIFQNNIEDFKNLIEDFDCVIIDEFQYAKNGGQKLKYLYDTVKIKFIISGSSSLELIFETGKYMVGRMINFELLPFSFREFLSFENKELFGFLQKKINRGDIFDFDVKGGFGNSINARLAAFLEKYVVYGGYPAVVTAKDEGVKQKILAGIIDNYLLKDISSLLNLVTDDELLRLARFLAVEIGGMVKYENLSNASGLTYKEVLGHLNILEKTFIIKLIKPFFANRKTELVKNPKCYFVDSGVRNFLLLDFRPIKLRNDAGALMENYARSLLSKLESVDLKYWRTKSKAEVDFVVQKQQNLYPIEVKYASKEVIGKSFYSFIEKYRPKIGIILTKDYLGEKRIGNTKIKFIPLGYF